MDLLHLNGIPADVRQTVAACGAPVVLARTGDGPLPLLLGTSVVAAMAAVVLAPYAVWLSVATALSVQYARPT